VAKNKYFNFLRVFSQSVSIPDCYFKQSIQCIILVTRVRLFNITPIFSMNSFITWFNIYIIFAINFPILGGTICFYVAYSFWHIIDCPFSVLVLRKRSKTGKTDLGYMLPDLCYYMLSSLWFIECYYFSP
jgi:hypothetical protein